MTTLRASNRFEAALILKDAHSKGDVVKMLEHGRTWLINKGNGLRVWMEIERRGK